MKNLIEYNRGLKTSSQRLRKQMTDAEKLFWSKVRRGQIDGLHFYRQKPIGQYIVDFYCPKAKIVIEIDGGQHYEVKGEAVDRIRDTYFRSQGLRILRFTNLEILKNIKGVMIRLLKEIR